MITTYMNYTVYLTSDADYNTALSLVGNGFINKAPRTLAGILGIPYPYPSGDLTTIDKTISFYFPFTPGQEFLLSPGGSTGIFVDDTVDIQIIPSNAGNPSSTWPPGQDTEFIWTANIVKANGDAETLPSSLTPIPQRRWIDGFEWDSDAGGGGSLFENNIRDASRIIDGKGYSLRGTTGNPTIRTTNGFRIITPATSWERFYIRVRKLPAIVNTGLWRCHGNTIPTSGYSLKLDTAGNVRGVSLFFNGETDNGIVFTPNINEWYLVDIFIKFTTGVGTDGRIKVFINHTEVFSHTDGGSWGLNSCDYHIQSDIGRWIGTDVECEVDFDDWICADLPSNINPVILDLIDPIHPNWSVDWLMGSHVRKHYTKSIVPGTWVGNKDALNQGDNSLAQLTNIITSNTSGDTLEGITDALALNTQDTIAAILGPVAATVYMYSVNGGNTDGKLGYKVAGGAAVLTTVDQIVNGNYTGVAYLPSGLIIPAEITPFSVVHSKSIDANISYVHAINTSIEYIGVWAEEDCSAFIYPISRLTNLHNCRYENTGWGYFGATPSAPVYSMGGTYVGNGTYQEIILPVPCHFLWLRALTGGAGTIRVLGSSIGAHYGTTDRVLPQNPRFFTDSLGITKFVISGDDVSTNKLGVTFQYIVFCDPGMRFNLCGEFAHAQATSTPKVNYLIDPNFIPEIGFCNKQYGQVSNQSGLSYKGQGNAGITGRYLDGTASADWGTFAAGLINSYSDLHSQNHSQAYSLWRTSEPGCAGVMVQACTYTGDGNATQVIPITPASGRYPLFVLVIPSTTAIAYFRDPSHTNFESSNANTTNLSNNGIRAVGIDEITVGVSLNTNGVVYHIFCFPGSDIGMLNGIYYNVNCDPPVTFHIVPDNLDGDIVVIGEGGIDLGDDLTDIMATKDLSGIYTIVPGQTHDILQDRLVGQPILNKKIPNPYFKTGYIGG